MSGGSRPLGAAVPRANADRLLTGRGRFVADVELPRMVHAVFVRSELPHAYIRGIDVSGATAIGDVVGVWTAAELGPPRLQSETRRQGLRITPQPVLAQERVRFVGEAVAVVAATSRYVGEDAAEEVIVDYEELAARVDPRAPDVDGFVALAPELEDDVVHEESATFGDPGAAFANAAHVTRAELHIGRSSAFPLEARGCVADYDPADRRLTVWCSTQGPHRLRQKLAAATGLAENRINVVMHDVGGAFGQKIPVQPEEVVVALLAIRLGRPVKWVEDRRENLMAAPHARDTWIGLDVAVGAEGEVIGLRAEIVGDAGAYSFNSASALTEPYLAARRLPGCYRLEHYAYHVRARLTNKSPIAPFRGVGNVIGQAVRELAIDAAARVAGCDRVAVRNAQLLAPEDLPYTTCTGIVLESGSFQQAFERVVRLVGYEDIRGSERGAAADGKRIGIGFSVFIEASGNGSELTRQVHGRPTISIDQARVSIDPSGTATVELGMTSSGQGIETTMAQVAADVLGMPVEHVLVVQTDTSSTPISTGGTRASRVAVVGAGAVGKAAEQVRRELLRVAAFMLDVRADELDIADGVVVSSFDPALSVSLREVAHAGHFSAEARAGVGAVNFSATASYDPGPTYGNGAIACVIELDEITGKVSLRKIVAVDDCGTAINPAVVDGQVRGGIANGIGTALFDRLVYDTTGQLTTTTLMDYRTSVATELVDIQLEHLCSPSPNTWRGIKAVGEGGAIGMPAALATAAADALASLGVVVDRLPLEPEQISNAIAKVKGESR